MSTSRLVSAPRRAVIGLFLVGSLFLAACGGVTGDSWAGLARDPDGNAIYVAYSDRVVALNPTSGAVQWEYKYEGAKFYAVPAIDDGMLYIGDYSGRLHSLNLQDGSRNWLYEPEKENVIGPISLTADDRVISGVAFNDDKVFFGLGSQNVMAVSRETAQELWTFKTGHGVWAAPLYVHAREGDENGRDTLYAVSLDHHLYAIDPDTGHELWKKNLGGAAPGNMVYDEQLNRLYIGTLTSELLAIDLDQRAILDRYDTEGWLWGSPALEVQEDGTEILYLGDLKGYLYAVEVTEGGFSQRWKMKVAEDAIRATPLLTDGKVIVGSKDKKVYAVSKEDGSSEWNDSTKGEALTELVLVPGSDSEQNGGVVVLGTSESEERIVAYNVETGEVDWRYSD